MDGDCVISKWVWTVSWRAPQGNGGGGVVVRKNREDMQRFGQHSGASVRKTS